MNKILFVGGFTITIIFLASIFTTSLLLRVSKYICFVFAPIGFLIWIYVGITKSSLLPPRNLNIIYFALMLENVFLTFLLTRRYKKRVIGETYTENLDRDSQRNFNYILIIIIGSSFLGGLYSLFDLIK